MKIKKNKVAKNFSKGVETYNNNAKIQTKMSIKLIDILVNKIKHNDSTKQILELGSGTGIFTDMLIKTYPDSNFLLSDISIEMIEYTKEKYSNNSKINFLCCDAETYSYNSKFDLIASNAVLQWYNNLDSSVKKYRNMLNKDGIFIFSIYGDKTYYELKKILNYIYGDNYFIQDFPTTSYIKQIIKSNFKNYYIYDEYQYQNFNGIVEYFKHIKNIGANSAYDRDFVFTPTKLKQIDKLYSKMFTNSSGQLVFTNHLIYVVASNTLKSHTFFT